MYDKAYGLPNDRRAESAKNALLGEKTGTDAPIDRVEL